MQEIKGQQKSGLTRNFRCSPIDIEGKAAGTLLPVDAAIEHHIRYIDRVAYEDGVMSIWWIGRFDGKSAIVFRSTYEPHKLWEADREILREMWACAKSERPSADVAAEVNGGDF